MASTTTQPRVNVRVAIPDIRPYRPDFRTVGTEVQRSTLTGGWETVALAETPEWAASIRAALAWLEHNPALSEAV